MTEIYRNLNSEKALIWRIIHRDNLPWVLANGLHCGNCKIHSKDWIHIGNAELISKRATHLVPLDPGGTLNDYVPFYFTPFSVMLKNIHSGWGVQRRANEEIIILVSNLHNIKATGLPFLFTDSHAYSSLAIFYNKLEDLEKVDWNLLQRRDFRRDSNDPRKLDRYQAEALVHKHCPVSALSGLICYNETIAIALTQQVQARGLSLKVHARPDWYFS